MFEIIIIQIFSFFKLSQKVQCLQLNIGKRILFCTKCSQLFPFDLFGYITKTVCKLHNVKTFKSTLSLFYRIIWQQLCTKECLQLIVSCWMYLEPVQWLEAQGGVRQRSRGRLTGLWFQRGCTLAAQRVCLVFCLVWLLLVYLPQTLLLVQWKHYLRLKELVCRMSGTS